MTQHITFTEVCEMLPNGVCWGDQITPAMAREIVENAVAAERKRHTKEVELPDLVRTLSVLRAGLEQNLTQVPAGICPDCGGQGEQGGQLCGGFWKCKSCDGTGKAEIKVVKP